MHSKEQLKKISETFFQALRDKNFNARFPDVCTAAL
jgi:hypothetical protein